ncbi:MAG: hypothetical protein IPI67_11570 [Myxococcales bacterium]|nr:hypothetical protein [Myxococcales bacterium]
MKSILFGVVAFANVAILTSRANADDSGIELLVGADVSYRGTTSVDLAKVAGASGYGTANDQSPGALSFEVSGGILFAPPIELRANAWIGVGGLALAQVERRYFGAEPEQIGSSLSVGVGGSGRYAPLLLPNLRFLVGPAVDVKRMAASSPAGAARLDLVGVGLDVGLRWQTSTLGQKTHGHLEVMALARRDIPTAVWVGASQDDVYFRGVGGSSPAIYSFGLSVGYVFSFESTL